MNEDMENREENISITSQLPKLLIIIAIIIALICGTWYAAHSLGWFQYALFDFGFLTNSPPAVTATVTSSPTAEPAISPTPALENQQAGEQAQVTPVPTAPPTVAPTEPPTPTPYVTAAPAHATYTLGKDIHVMVDGKEVVFRTFTYSGGYIPADDPWFASEKEKETPESYGRPIYGKTPQELTYNWLREVCKSPYQVIRLRTQMGMITPKSLEKEDKLALELAAKPAKDYDAVVNETLQAFFKKLDGGRIESSTDWDLENYMLAVEDDDSGEVNLRGRENHDDGAKPEDKDILLTFYAKGSKTTFVSSKRGWLNTADNAKVSSSKFSQRAWVNMTEGGTWKWKAKGSGGSNTNPPGGNTPTPAPTSTPTPTSGPTNTPRPTKDPGQRPTVSDAPVGGGSTNPENSTDPHTTDHTESTPAPANTATPAPTAAPTAVPTAVVRPTEVCETAAPTPIREDTATQPPADDDHNAPTDKPAGTGDTDFDPGSI